MEWEDGYPILALAFYINSALVYAGCGVMKRSLSFAKPNLILYLHLLLKPGADFALIIPRPDCLIFLSRDPFQ
jgi:hypothetical protein